MARDEKRGGDRLENGAVEPACEPDTLDDLLDFDAQRRPSAEAEFPETLVRAFLKWFGGRGDVYARQWYDGRRNESGYWPVRQPVTPAVVCDHLGGRISIGQYLLYPDNTVSFAVLDFDPIAPTFAGIDDDASSGGKDRRMLEYARDVHGTATDCGLRSYIEDSGGFGYHLWFFFDPRVPAAHARRLLQEVVRRTRPQPPILRIEIFPKQDRLTGKGLGNLIKLPFGIHLMTMRASRFLTDDGEPDDVASTLSRIRACEHHAIEHLLDHRVIPLAAPAGEAEVRTSRVHPKSATSNARALAVELAETRSADESQKAVDRILQRCGILRKLVRKAYEEHVLAPDEARALLYTIGLVGRDNPRIDELFAIAGVSRKELDRVRVGYPSPMGCKKLMQMFGELVPGGCACPHAPVGGYATPVQLGFVFSRSEPKERGREWPPVETLPRAPWEERLDAVEQRLARIEELLRSFTSSQGETGES